MGENIHWLQQKSKCEETRKGQQHAFFLRLNVKQAFLLRLNVKEAISPSFLASLLFDLLHRIMPVAADAIPAHTMEISPFPTKPQYNWNLIMWFFYMFWDIWPFKLYFIEFWLNIFICSKDLIAEMI